MPHSTFQQSNCTSKVSDPAEPTCTSFQRCKSQTLGHAGGVHHPSRDRSPRRFLPPPLPDPTAPARPPAALKAPRTAPPARPSPPLRTPCVTNARTHVRERHSNCRKTELINASGGGMRKRRPVTGGTPASVLHSSRLPREHLNNSSARTCAVGKTTL